jgi:Glutathione S-transferase, N-terminal domain
MQLILYYAPNACSLVPYVTLTEASAPFEILPLNFRKSQHMTAEYLQLNPKHKVPVLVIDGETLTENVAIQIWIARNFPAAKLLPADPMQDCARSPCWPGAPRVFIPSFHALIRLRASATYRAQRSPCGGLPRSSCSITTTSRTMCSPIANGFSTTSPPSMPTSSGAFGEAPNSTSISPSLRIAWHISSG